MKPIQVGLLGIGTVGSGIFNVLQAQPGRDPAPRRPRHRDHHGGRPRHRRARKPSSATAAQVVERRARGHRQPRDRHRRRADRRLRHRQGSWCWRPSRTASTWSPPTRRCWPCTAPRSSPRRSDKGVMVAFEAAVAGGIPIIKALREGLTANRIEWIAGIINGTTNFILSEMRDKGLDFDVVLKEAQRLGYAEADPTFDIEGVDAAHKATIMSAHRLRHPGAVRQGLRRGHHQAAARRTSATPSSWATASSCWASPSARAQGHRAARAPDAGAGQAPDRQRRRRDERGGGAGRRRRHHAVLRQGRGQPSRPPAP